MHCYVIEKELFVVYCIIYPKISDRRAQAKSVDQGWNWSGLFAIFWEHGRFVLEQNHSVGPEVYGICACTFFWDCTSTDKLFVQGGRLETVSRFVVFVSFDYFSVK